VILHTRVDSPTTTTTHPHVTLRAFFLGLFGHKIATEKVPGKSRTRLEYICIT
jgi:hypothetical protein